MKSFPGVVGANLSLRRDVFTRCQGFRTGIGRIGRGMMAYDESELVVRALALGFRLFSAPDVRVQHWTPWERACPEYICRAAAGFAQGRVVAKEPFGFKAALRSLVGHAYLFSKAGAQELRALPSRDTERILRHRVWRVTGQAGFAAAVRRCLRRGELVFAPR